MIIATSHRTDCLFVRLVRSYFFSSLLFIAKNLNQVWYVWYGMVWYSMVWYGMVCLVWYGVVWYGMVWYSMVWRGMQGCPQLLK